MCCSSDSVQHPLFGVECLTGLELTNQPRLPLPPQDWDYKHTSPHPALFVLNVVSGIELRSSEVLHPRSHFSSPALFYRWVYHNRETWPLPQDASARQKAPSGAIIHHSRGTPQAQHIGTPLWFMNPNRASLHQCYFSASTSPLSAPAASVCVVLWGRGHGPQCLIHRGCCLLCKLCWSQQPGPSGPTGAVSLKRGTRGVSYF